MKLPETSCLDIVSKMSALKVFGLSLLLFLLIHSKVRRKLQRASVRPVPPADLLAGHRTGLRGRGQTTQ